MKNLKRLALRITAAFLFCIAVQAVHAQSPPSAPPTNTLFVDSFSDTNAWTSDAGYYPSSFTNLVGDWYGDGTSLMVDSNSPAWLQFPVFNSDNTTNLTVGTGSIFFWVSPDWASATTNSNGAGPGLFARLLEVGAYSTNATYGWFSLFVDPGATNIYFATQTNSGDGAVYTNLSAPIDWATNVWEFVALTYSPTNLSLYTNGVLATNAPGLTVYPGLGVLTNGFWIGSASNGVLQMQGWMDDLYAYDYSLDSMTVSNIYTWFYGMYEILPFGNVMPDALIQSGPSSPSVTPTFNAITGSGDLTVLSNAASCVSSSQVWITNIVAVPAGTNMNVIFTIAGGSNGVPYDVFANNVLNFSLNTNFPWAWMGQGYQCVTYELTNIPGPSCFLILGTPQDSYGQGLTDAYEWLVLQKNPAATSGDGMLDGWKVLWGMNPNINNVAQPSERANYTYDGTGRLELDTGIENEIFNFDPEGNIQLDQQ